MNFHKLKLTACVLSPYNYYENTEDAPYDYGGGLFCLLFGWAGMLFHEGVLKIYFLAWYSNITYLVAIICFILKSASNLNGNLNCSKELEHYAS